MKKKLGLIVVSVIAVVAIFGVVNAQEQTEQPQPLVQQAGSLGGREPILRQLLQIVADDLGVQPADVLQQLRGQTLGDVIAANNGDAVQITADVIAAITDQVNQAVADGRLTQERADQLLGNLDTRIQDALQGNGLLRQLSRRGNLRQHLERPFFHDGVRPLLSAATEATGLTAQEIGQAMRSGKPLADIISEHGGSPDSVIASAVAAAKAQLDPAVTNGQLTQVQEDAIVKGLQALYEAVMNGAFGQPASTGAV